MQTKHITDDRESDLLLYAAGYGTVERREAMAAHIEACTEGCKEFVVEHREIAESVIRDGAAAEEELEELSAEELAEEEAMLERVCQNLHRKRVAWFAMDLALGRVRIRDETDECAACDEEGQDAPDLDEPVDGKGAGRQS